MGLKMGLDFLEAVSVSNLGLRVIVVFRSLPKQVTGIDFRWAFQTPAHSSFTISPLHSAPAFAL